MASRQNPFPFLDRIPMRLLRSLAPLACVIAIVCMHQPTQGVTQKDAPVKYPVKSVRIPAPKHGALLASGRTVNNAYGPSMAQINGRAAALTANSIGATFNISLDPGFTNDANAQAALKAALNIWSQVIVSSVPINVYAQFDTNFSDPNALGDASPAVVCSLVGGPANTFYAAALANALTGNNGCNDGSAGTYEIYAHL